MLYFPVKIMVRLALKIFCRKLTVSNREALQKPGPLLLVANHPNSFLDAIIIGSQCRHKVHFLARGDAFNKPWHSKLLCLLNMIPVYRLSEGKENLFLNEAAFSRSKEILSENGILLIFIEGICVHKHELQPFKKGAARIAADSRDLPGFAIVPLGIAYDSFERFGKQININVGNAVEPKNILPYEDPAQNFRYFNTVLYEEISKRIIIPQSRGRIKSGILDFPAKLGEFIHTPLYELLRNKIRKKTEGTVFFDSVLFGSLLIMYPLYLLLLGFLLCSLGIPLWVTGIVLFFHPLTAWCTVHGR